MKIRLVAVALASAALIYLGVRGCASDDLSFASHRGEFREMHLPARSYWLFDIGVVDFDSDGWYDVFTTNHNAPQSLLRNEAGHLVERFDGSGLRRPADFFVGDVWPPPRPVAGRSGPALTIQLFDRRNFRICCVSEACNREWEGRIETPNHLEIVKNAGFTLATREPARAYGNYTYIYSARRPGCLVLRSRNRLISAPHVFGFSGEIQLSEIGVGWPPASPASNPFTLLWRDRHGMAWSDYNGDGALDVAVVRGGLRRRLGELPMELYDELFIATLAGFSDQGEQLGMGKRGCPGRQVSWQDADDDGSLDLYIACEKSPYPSGSPNRLLSHGAEQKFHERAQALHLDISDNGAYRWLDANRDGKTDLLWVGESGIHVLEYGDGVFRKRLVSARSEAPEAIQPRVLEGGVALQVFVASRKGNKVLELDRTGYRVREAVTLGLPRASFTGNWVDYDNDGITDFYAFPDGLYQGRPDGTFTETGVLRADLDRAKIQAAISHWVDIDNNGARDLILAVHPNATLAEKVAFRAWQRSVDLLGWNAATSYAAERLKHPDEWSVMLYANAPQGGWIHIDVTGPPGNSIGVGAEVTLRAGSTTQSQVVGSNESSRFSQGHYRLYFGLGNSPRAEQIQVRWPDGTDQELREVEANRVVRLTHPQAHHRTDGSP